MATEMYFNNQALSTEIAGSRITNISRPVRAARERNKVVIPGKDGTYDFGNNRQEDYIITVEIVIEANSAGELQQRISQLASYLNGKHGLRFSDAPTVKHVAQVYDEVTAVGDATARWARCLVIFECDAGDKDE